MAGIRVSYSKISLHPALSLVQTDVSKPEIYRCLAKIIFWGKFSSFLLRIFLPTGDKFKVIWLAVAVWFNERNAKYNDDDVTFLCPINHCEIAHSFWVIMSKRAARICKYRRLYIGHCDQPTNLMKDCHRDILAYFDLLFTGCGIVVNLVY